MPNPDHHSHRVTLEDLLHLKRAERPAPEFWDHFESELRQKQLAALLERRPWWQGVPHFFTRRAYLPVGAAAMVVLTMVAVKYYSPEREVRAFEPVAGVRHAVHLKTVAVAQHSAAAVAPRETAEAPAVSRTAVLLSERLPERATELTPWSAPLTEETPSAKSIAASIARLELSEPDLASAALGGQMPAASSRLQPEGGRVSVELASVSSLASRRTRLLAQLDDRRFTPEPQAPELVRERLARRLADSDFNDGLSRVGLERGGVSLKF